jgi:hypothetical protein
MSTTLSGKCDIYGINNECKEKCSNISTNNDEECSGRTDECFWLNERASETPVGGNCVEKV